MSQDFESQVASVDDFSGGMTDFVFEGIGKEFSKADNYLLTPDKKLITRPGSEINSATVYQVPSGQKRIGSLFSYEDTLFVQAERNIYVAGASWQNTGPVNPALSIGTSAAFIAHTYWNRHIIVTNDEYAKPIKIFKSGSNYVARTAGMPSLASTPSASGTAGANNYIYAFTYAYQYTIDGVTFEDEGPVTQLEVPSVNAPNVNNITLSSIPVITNASTDNYDTANIKVRIYRTENNQTVLYRVAEISNGTTSYVDSMADATLINQVTIYTTGGVVENSPPPLAKYVHSIQGVTYYASIKEGSALYKNRLRQSLFSDPDSCPADFYLDMQQDIVGITSFDGNPLVFTKSKIYRIEGIFDELGNGGMVAREVSETIGAISHNSLVQTKTGVFFAGNDGFYWTDGYKLQRVNERTISRFKTATMTDTQKSKVYGVYDKLNDRVYWSMLSTNAATDNDTLWVLDLRFGMQTNSCFTTWSGGTSFVPTAITFHLNTLYRGDSRGYLLRHDDSFLTDPKIDTAVAPSLWNKNTIIYDYVSSFANFNMPQVRKWISRMLVSIRNISNVSVQIYSHNDDTNVFVPMIEIKDTSQCVWGSPTPVWGADTPWWNYFKLIEEMRRFPAKSLRCTYKQIRITNAYTLIADSSSLGTASVDGSKNTVLTGFSWPADCVDYYISFDFDDYATEYLVTSQSGSTLVFSDSGNVIPAGTYSWKLKGYAKGEICNLLGFVVYYTPISKSFKPYIGGTNA